MKINFNIDLARNRNSIDNVVCNIYFNPLQEIVLIISLPMYTMLIQENKIFQFSVSRRPFTLSIIIKIYDHAKMLVQSS